MLGESPQFKAMTGKYHSSAKLQATNLFFSVNSKIYNVFSTNLLGLSHMFAVHRIFETDRFNTQFLNSASNLLFNCVNTSKYAEAARQPTCP